MHPLIAIVYFMASALDALYSFLTPRNPIKVLGGLLSPGTLTGARALERDRETERERESVE